MTEEERIQLANDIVDLALDLKLALWSVDDLLRSGLDGYRKRLFAEVFENIVKTDARRLTNADLTHHER